jgi:hypothetical protein
MADEVKFPLGEYVAVHTWGVDGQLMQHIPSGTSEGAKQTAEANARTLQEKFRDDLRWRGAKVKTYVYYQIAVVDGGDPAEIQADSTASAEKKPIEPKMKCATCDHLGRKEEFKMPKGHRCSKCQSEDAVPYRRYKCTKCGKEESEDFWFPEWHYDDSPLTGGGEAKPCEGCVKKFEQSQIGVTTDDTLDEYWDRMHELEKTPVELEEVNVELPSSS